MTRATGHELPQSFAAVALAWFGKLISQQPSCSNDTSFNRTNIYLPYLTFPCPYNSAARGAFLHPSRQLHYHPGRFCGYRPPAQLSWLHKPLVPLGTLQRAAL
jgi:hypothetical protein